MKRARKRELSYLEPDEVAAILSQPDRTTVEGQRDHALLALLYNTGARIQEALDLCPRACAWTHLRRSGSWGKAAKSGPAPCGRKR